MTKVQVHFDLVKPLDENYDSIVRAHGVYGIFYIKVNADRNGLIVEYDASRMSIAELHAELIKAGVPASPTIP